MILLLVLSLTLTACSDPFDASGYVTACMDASFHQSYESYAEFVDCTIEEAEETIYQQNQTIVDKEIAALEEITVSEEQKKEYLSLIMACKSQTKYEVQEAVETENGYDVSVVVYPLDVFLQFKSGLKDQYQQAANDHTLDADTIFPLTLEYLKQCMDQAQYEEAVTYVVSVRTNEDGVWTMSSDDLFALEELLLPLP